MRLDDRYPGAIEGHDDPDSVFYRGTDGPITVNGRTYDDRNPYGISCGNPSCRAAGDCYCDGPGPVPEEGTLPPWFEVEIVAPNGYKATTTEYHYRKAVKGWLDFRDMLTVPGLAVTVRKYATYRGQSLLMSEHRF